VLASPDDAEEAVQEALMRAWRRSDRCRNPEAPLAWILQITRNEALRLATRHGSRARSERSDGAATEHAVDAQDVEDVVGRLALEQACSGISPDERVLLALRYIDDLTQPEIARRLGIPEGTVKVRLHRTRARLRSALEDDSP
jgi:RNA polymerase sigma-70 factor, ECF subfamily